MQRGPRKDVAPTGERFETVLERRSSFQKLKVEIINFSFSPRSQRIRRSLRDFFPFSRIGQASKRFLFRTAMAPLLYEIEEFVACLSEAGLKERLPFFFSPLLFSEVGGFLFLLGARSRCHLLPPD